MSTIPADNSPCPRCNRGVIHWHATGATCQYCGRTWDNGLAIPFVEIQIGELFISGGAYIRQNDETVYQKIVNQRHNIIGTVNAKNTATKSYAYFGPGARVLPLKPGNFLEGQNHEQ